MSNRQFLFLSKKLPIGVALFKIVYDHGDTPVDFITREVNPEFLRTLCISRNQVLNKPASQVYPQIKQCPINWMDIYRKANSSSTIKRFEVHYPSRDNIYRIYVFSPKKDYCIAALMDVTKEKQIEQKRVSAEKMFRRLYETTQDGIMARDLHGKMLDCNEAYAKMLGYTKKELKNMSVKDLLPERWLEQREKIAAKVIQTGRSIIFEREYIRRDNSVFPASVRTWRLTDGKGKVIGVWSIVRDISEQKALQKELEKHAGVLEQIIQERTKQLKDTERLVAIGQTAGMVGHDLRNPLQTIIGELYLAKRDVEALVDDGSKGNLQESIQVIEEQVAYMDKIVSDLQAFVQPVKIDKRLIIFKELVTNVLASVAVPSNISVEAKIQEGFPPIAVDAHLLKRVLINLVTNAVQAMPNGGKLLVTAKVDPQGGVSVAVKDSGVGISDAIKPQIFTPLFTTKSRGQGFGLAVCKRVIEAHGGAIKFESTEGQGTEFTIQFPAI